MTRVIVVDDSKVIRNAASKMLRAEFDVVSAEDGADAWTQLEGDPSIQVVFTDLVMPGVNGYELLRNIRTASDARIRGLPVIIVTGVEDDEVARVRALELGATDFITKPFTTIDLVARARAHASHQRETSQLRAQTTLDAPTGLANKAGFLDRLQQDMAYARRHKQELILVRIEIDELRAIFLKQGKDAAERLLLNIAHLLRATIRKEDTAGRVTLGGFALSLPAGEAQGIQRMIDRVRAEVARQWTEIVGPTFPLKLSAAVFRPALESALSAQDALDQCQAKLAVMAESQPASAQTTPPVERPAPAAVQPPAPVQAARALLIDPLLEQIERGNPQPAIAGMPLVLRRLLPLLRLLDATQHAGLMRFLQQLRP